MDDIDKEHRRMDLMGNPANTAANNQSFPEMSLAKILEATAELKKKMDIDPSLFAIDYAEFPVMVSNNLMPNTVIISKDIAIELGIWDK